MIRMRARPRRLPAVASPDFAEAAGLAADGPDYPDLWRRAAGLIDQLLNGTRPRLLPVERPAKFALVLNAAAARAFDLAILPALRCRTDRVPE
jgi:putative ABC transport system substrate-binding protein